MKKKMLWGIIIASIILFALILLYYFVYPSSCRVRYGMVPGDCHEADPRSNPSDWKVYTNEKFGFTFNYPANLSTIHITENSVSIINPEDMDDFKKAPEGKDSFLKFDTSTCKLTEDSCSKYLLNGFGKSKMEASKERFQIDGVQAYGNVEYGISGGTYEIVMTRNGVLYILSFPPGYREIEFKKDRILSTFKFTDN